MAEMNEIDGMVLCGGLGTRLRETIGEHQKVMAQIEDQPFLDIVLKYLKAQGLNRVVLCTGFKSEDLENYYQNHSLGLEIVFSKESEPLGTGGAVKNAREHIRSSQFVVLNGDCLCPIDYAKLIRFHQAKGALATMVVSKVKEAKDYGTIEVAEDGQITAHREKDVQGVANVNAGIYCFEKEIFDHMPAEKKFSMEEDFFTQLTDHKFYGFEVEEEFIDIGTPERFEKINQFLKKAGL